MSAVKCPDWCTQTTADNDCDGSHMRLEHGVARVASGSPFPIIDERGAVFPAVSAGISSSPSEGVGPHVFLFMTGPEFGDGRDVAFPLDQAFGLAIDILDMYAKVIQEINSPRPPWTDAQALRPIVELIEHNWSTGAPSSIENRITGLKDRLRQMDPVADMEAYDSAFKQLIALEHRRRESLQETHA